MTDQQLSDTRPRGRGRPTKYTRQLASNLPEMFSEGQSVAEVCLELRISRATYYLWIDRYARFKRAHEEAQFVSEAWWSRLGRLGAAAQVPINSTVWAFNMKNRFKWRDRPAPEQVSDDEMTPEEFARRSYAALQEMEELDGRSGEGEIADAEMDTPRMKH